MVARRSNPIAVSLCSEGNAHEFVSDENRGRISNLPILRDNFKPVAVGVFAKVNSHFRVSCSDGLLRWRTGLRPIFQGGFQIHAQFHGEADIPVLKVHPFSPPDQSIAPVFHRFPNPDFQGFCLVFARNKSVIPRKFKRDVFQAFFRLKRPVQQLLSARGAENRGKDEKQERTIYTFPFLFLEIFTCCKVPSSCFSCSSWWRLLSERHGCPRRSCWRAVRFHDGRRLRRSCPRLRRRAPDHGHSDC